MVRVKAANTPLSIHSDVNLEQWFLQLVDKQYLNDIASIRKLFLFMEAKEKKIEREKTCIIKPEEMSCLKLALAMADLLSDLKADHLTILAAIVFISTNRGLLSLTEVESQLNSDEAPVVLKLMKGVEKMSAIHHFQTLNKSGQRKTKTHNLRKMLLAMVDDVRVILIKLAEQLCLLRVAVNLDNPKEHLARDAMNIYAPLANRLGIGALKWEIEDHAFRILHPSHYKAIAQGLKAKRLDRDNYVNTVVEALTLKIEELGLKHFKVYGRSKHIHSIFSKMKRKNVSLEEIYDATAIRVLVDTQGQCYEVLSLVHAIWCQVPREFDDYISHPKSNGYQSLHTAVSGPLERVFEVQIRTFRMHELAEMGIAAHWRYKEGSALQIESHERKIEWLRGVLAWHQELTSASVEQDEHGELNRPFLEDRVYVFTPEGDVLDLPKGVTPLDFAYHVHTEVGHRCRGAKVNNVIVPLHSQLKTGDRVEILTGKEARPSRDWVSPQRHFLMTHRARSKVLHWFKMQDYDEDRERGEDIAEKALKTLGMKTEVLNVVLEDLHFKQLDDLFAALGRNDIKMGQILNKRTLQVLIPVPEVKDSIEKPVVRESPSKILPSAGEYNLKIGGIDNVLTHQARCCNPLPGDEAVGYITVGRGISVHKTACPNVLRASQRQQGRLFKVNW